MKPNKKAKQLIEKYYQISPELFGTLKAQEYAIKCALIVCDESKEILNKPMFQYKESMLWKAENEYWDEVKEEIKKN